MGWWERLGISALGAVIGALLTLLWLGDGGDEGVVERRATDRVAADEPDPVDLARLEEEIAAQASALAQLDAVNAELTLRLSKLERREDGDSQSRGPSAALHSGRLSSTR